MAATYKFIFNRNNRLKKDGTAPIHLRVVSKRKIWYINTDISIEPKQWSDKNGGTIIKHRKAPELNKALNDLYTNISDYEINCINTKVPFSPTDAEQNISEQLFTDFMRAEIQADSFLSVGSYKNQMATLGHIIKFGKFKYFADINFENLERFDAYLAQCMNLNTRSTRQRHLKKYVSRAIKKGHIINDPYTHFTLPQPSYQKRKFLSADMLHTIATKEMIPRLALVRDIFIFSCYTGLSYADVRKLQPADFYEYNKTTFIVTDRSKTNEESSIPLLPQAKAIIERYYDKDQESLLPILSNQRMNGYLKEIQLICEIQINLTFHVARHTFATTVTLENGVPIETVSRMLGHKSLKTTQIYAKLTRKKLADDMAILSKKI